jgi:hypothetical protein
VPRTVAFLPGADFARSVPAAEAQIPVATRDGEFLDCRDGRPAPWAATPEILDYQIDGANGRIVARTGSGAVQVTTWTRHDPSSLRTTAGPPLPPGGSVSFDRAGQLALTYSSTGRGLALYRHDGQRWLQTLSLAVGLSRVVEAQVVDGGTLVLAVGPRGGFELFDATTGRLVASDPGLEASYAQEVTGFSTRRVNDDLFVVLDTADDADASATVRIPIGIPALRRQLCSLYPATECAI